MNGGEAMVKVSDYYRCLSDASQLEVNDFIEYLYHKENKDETLAAIEEARSGKTVGPFNSVEEFLDDLYAED